MSTDAATIDALALATGLNTEEVKIARRDWRPTNGMRKILNAEANRLIEQVRSAMESGTAATFAETKGRLTGIREMLAAINAQGPL